MPVTPHTITAASATSWSTVNTAAVPISPSWIACRHTSTSSVRVPAAPITRTTPNEVNVKTNTIDAAATSAGRISGSVIKVNTRQGDAPSDAAAPSMSVGSCSQNGPTVRTTTARLNTTWAAMTAATLRFMPSGRSARNAAPMTTVGRTKSAVSNPSKSCRPRKSNRATMYAGARPTTRVSSVETTACHSVNHATSHVAGRPRVVRTAPPSMARDNRFSTGQT